MATQRPKLCEYPGCVHKPREFAYPVDFPADCGVWLCEAHMSEWRSYGLGPSPIADLHFQRWQDDKTAARVW